MKRRPLSHEPRFALNAICPYFTMFPLEFPLRILSRHRTARVVFDPFCGRGTTLFAARVRGQRGVGIDVSPVAVAISRAKLSTASVQDTLALARRLIKRSSDPKVPDGEFWDRAFHRDTLRDLCAVRDSLLRQRTRTAESVLLCGAILGVLHGPKTDSESYLSNQMPRTFAPKPAYAAAFWRKRRLNPPRIRVLHAIERKLKLLELSLARAKPAQATDVILGDSSKKSAFRNAPRRIDVVVTSPPYYGMRTYVQDQWLRNWFLGGSPSVDYSPGEAIPSSSPADFAEALGHTWSNLAVRTRDELHLYVRFGAIPSRAVDAEELLLNSLESSGIKWRVVSVRNARNADAGKRQMRHMQCESKAVDELDLHAVAS